jgi:hypothetical protein
VNKLVFLGRFHHFALICGGGFDVRTFVVGACVVGMGQAQIPLRGTGWTVKSLLMNLLHSC